MKARSLIPLALLLLAAFSLTWVALRESPVRTVATSPEPYGPGEVQVTPRRDCVQVIDMRTGVMGTRFVVEVAAPDEETGRRATHAAYARIHELEQTFSTWIEDSLLSRLNREAAGVPFPVDSTTFHLLQAARTASRRTGGAFDPTVGPLVRLWRKAARDGRVPPDPDVAAARDVVGFDSSVLLDERSCTVRLQRPGASIDLGGIAKGYAADDAASVAIAAGALACRVNAGGDHVAVGAPAWSPEGFRVVVRDPQGEESDGLEDFSFQIEDRGIATSGNYERYAEIEGKRYSHIIDPRSGRPVENPVLQVTVLAPNGTDADALATALAVLGVEHGLRFAESAHDVEAMFVTREGGALAFRRTSGFPGDPR